jgi:PKD repeat protein
LCSPVIGSDGTIYIGNYGDYKIYAINPDGTFKWSYATGAGIRDAPAIGSDGTLYVGSNDYKVYAFRDAPAVTPVADFSADPVSGTALLKVTFTDLSTNTPTSWLWDFGDSDSTNATQQNPVHTYAAAGTYTVSLTATNSAGSDDETKTDYITVTVSNLPTAAFSATPTSGTAPLTVQFTDESTSLDTSTEERVTNGGFETGDETGWTDAGDVWTIQTATVHSGSYAEYCQIVEEIGDHPAISQSVDLTGVDHISFWYYLQQGEGPNPTLKVAIDSTVVGSYETMYAWTSAVIDTSSYAGTHTITLYGNDAQGNGEIYLDDFSAVGTSGITAWAWTFGDGGTSDLQSPGHEYTAAGNYDVTLTVTDANGSDEETKNGYITVSTAVIAPVADFTAAPTSGTAPLTVTFTDLSTNSPTSWLWDFGDGGTSTDQNPSHQYTAAGTYTVTLTATNAAGSDDETKTGYISVSAPLEPPVANFNVVLDGDGKMPHGKAPVTVSFTDASTGTVGTYLWEYRNYDDTTWTAFGAGAQNPTGIVFSEAGTYDIRLTVSNTAGSDTATIVHAFTAGNLHDYLTTVQSGTVSGDLFIDSRSPWADTAATYSYTLPASGSNIVWARVFVNDYSGSGTNNFPLGIRTELDADGDGTFEALLGEESGDIQSETNGESPDGQPYTYPVNDHMKKVYSDYEVWYDVTSMLTSTTPQIRVTSLDIGAPVGPDSGYDGRIKAVTLVVAYNDGDSDQVRYIVNHGNDWMTGSSSTGFDATTFPSGWSSAEIRGVAFSSIDASPYTLNSATLTKNLLGTNGYYQYNSFDVTSGLLAGSSNTFGFTNTGPSFKICLATLTADYPGVVAPVAAFEADDTTPVTGQTVQFTDASTNTPTGWAWTIEGTAGTDYTYVDGTSAASQNPHVQFLVAGTYDVTLVATNAAGSDDETKTAYITVTSAILPLPGQANPPTDPDSDGLYEDLNGNGELEFNDVQIYFREMDWIAANEPVALFDFNSNGDIEFNDVQILFREI